MKKIVMLLVALSFVFCASQVFSAATVTRTGRIVEITAIDADWLWSTTFTGAAEVSGGIKVVSIEFLGGAANDIIVINDQTDAGAVMMKRKTPDTDYSTIKYFFGARIRPVINFSDCTLSSGHKIIITLSD